ncbi:ankyrin repeat-containing domain protein [Aspergillus navahoensis]
MGDYTSVRLLLSEGASIDIQRAGGITPLHDAIIQQNVDIVECLLHEGANPSMPDDQQNSAFHLASEFDFVEILDLLWAASSETQITAVNASNNAPLHIASRKNCPKAVRWLLDAGAEVDQVGEHERTPLHLASMEGNDSIVWILLEDGADRAAGL